MISINRPQAHPGMPLLEFMMAAMGLPIPVTSEPPIHLGVEPMWSFPLQAFEPNDIY